LKEFGLNWEKVKDFVKQRCCEVVQSTHADLQLSVFEDSYNLITAEECEKRWSIIRKTMTNAQISKTFPAWTEQEVRGVTVSPSLIFYDIYYCY
jgi:hypothetical protein